MVCTKENVYAWFRESPSFERIDLMCNLLSLSMPFEIRFLASCLEDFARKHYVPLLEYERKANDSSSYNPLLRTTTISPSSSAVDQQIINTLTVYVSLIQSDNVRCATCAFQVLSQAWEQMGIDGLMSDSAALCSLDPQFIDNFTLVLTMAVFHPAFDFGQRVELFEMLDSFHTMLNRQEVKNGCVVEGQISERIENNVARLHLSKATTEREFGLDSVDPVRTAVMHSAGQSRKEKDSINLQVLYPELLNLKDKISFSKSVASSIVFTNSYLAFPSTTITESSVWSKPEKSENIFTKSRSPTPGGISNDSKNSRRPRRSDNSPIDTVVSSETGYSSPIPSLRSSPFLTVSSTARSSPSSPRTNLVDDGTVGCWLKNRRLHKYQENLSKYTWEQLLKLTEDDLLQEGLTLGACTKFLTEIRQLKNSGLKLNSNSGTDIDLSDVTARLDSFSSPCSNLFSTAHASSPISPRVALPARTPRSPGGYDVDSSCSEYSTPPGSPDLSSSRKVGRVSHMGRCRTRLTDERSGKIRDGGAAGFCSHVSPTASPRRPSNYSNNNNSNSSNNNSNNNNSNSSNNNSNSNSNDSGVTLILSGCNDCANPPGTEVASHVSLPCSPSLDQRLSAPQAKPYTVEWGADDNNADDSGTGCAEVNGPTNYDSADVRQVDIKISTSESYSVNLSSLSTSQHSTADSPTDMKEIFVEVDCVETTTVRVEDRVSFERTPLSRIDSGQTAEFTPRQPLPTALPTALVRPRLPLIPSYVSPSTPPSLGSPGFSSHTNNATATTASSGPVANSVAPDTGAQYHVPLAHLAGLIKSPSSVFYTLQSPPNVKPGMAELVESVGSVGDQKRVDTTNHSLPQAYPSPRFFIPPPMSTVNVCNVQPPWPYQYQIMPPHGPPPTLQQQAMYASQMASPYLVNHQFPPPTLHSPGPPPPTYSLPPRIIPQSQSVPSRLTSQCSTPDDDEDPYQRCHQCGQFLPSIYSSRGILPASRVISYGPYTVRPVGSGSGSIIGSPSYDSGTGDFTMPRIHQPPSSSPASYLPQSGYNQQDVRFQPRYPNTGFPGPSGSGTFPPSNPRRQHKEVCSNCGWLGHKYNECKMSMSDSLPSMQALSY